MTEIKTGPMPGHGRPLTSSALAYMQEASSPCSVPLVHHQVMDEVRAALAANPGYRLQLVGHSMGAGTAAILTMM